DTAVVDPSEADPVLERIDREKVDAKAILNTHHHRDHTGGNSGILQRHKLAVYGHKSDRERIPGITRPVDEGDEVAVGKARGRVFFIPGHTTGHVAYLFGKNLVWGHTLSTAGCGRLFEGPAEQMLDSLKKLKALPADTLVWCGHEYTENNLKFALTLEPGNRKLAARMERVGAARAAGRPTVPATMAEEIETNPFLRWGRAEIKENLRRRFPEMSLNPVSVFATVRQLKDQF